MLVAAAARRAVRTMGIRLTSSTAARSFSSLGPGLASNSATPYNAPLIRSFGSKKSNKQKGKGDRGGEREGGTRVMLLDQEDDEYFEKPVKDMNDLVGKVAEVYEVNKNEITNGDFTLQFGEPSGIWEDLKSFNQLKKKAEEEGIVPHVRLAELSYEEEDYDYTGDDDEGEDDEYGGDDDNMGEDYMNDDLYGTNVDSVIRDLIGELREAGWSRPDAGLLKKESGEELMARDYILQSAKENQVLRNILVARIGAMDHILQCLQYEFLWEEPSLDYANDMENDDETSKDAEFTEK